MWILVYQYPFVNTTYQYTFVNTKYPYQISNTKWKKSIWQYQPTNINLSVLVSNCPFWMWDINFTMQACQYRFFHTKQSILHYQYQTANLLISGRQYQTVNTKLWFIGYRFQYQTISINLSISRYQYQFVNSIPINFKLSYHTFNIILSVSIWQF